MTLLASDGTTLTVQATRMHFRMKLSLAEPESFLPSALTAFGKHASRLHFLRKLLSAAPANGLPFLPTALLAKRFLRNNLKKDILWVDFQTAYGKQLFSSGKFTIHLFYYEKSISA